LRFYLALIRFGHWLTFKAEAAAAVHWRELARRGETTP
jgi:hypothetical protein